MPDETIRDTYEEALLDYERNAVALASKIGELAREAEELYQQSLRPENRRAWRSYCDISCDRSILQGVEAEMAKNTERRKSALEQALLFFRLAEMDENGGISDSVDDMEIRTNTQIRQRYLN
ncbi:MAG: hypothetical protein Q8R53_02070 [Nanoarchaeota archaeon]|nr:hypothetical protein [Nanoarchaeota archaeon]